MSLITHLAEDHPDMRQPNGVFRHDLEYAPNCRYCYPEGAPRRPYPVDAELPAWQTEGLFDAT